MKYDMSGGGAVMGAMMAAAGLKIPLHIVGLIPATENLPSGSAQKPGYCKDDGWKDSGDYFYRCRGKDDSWRRLNLCKR